jgi:hypothetical protein
MEAPKPLIAAGEPEGFPRVYVVIKWTIIVSLTLLSILAAAFWTLVLGGFAASGFHAPDQAGKARDFVVTPECAWPYGVHDYDATAVCRMFYNLSPEQRAQVLKARK